MTENVDEFKNKLSLANSIYINNDWFILCCKVMALVMALGVDEDKKKHSEYRSWAVLKTFFSEKLSMLQEMKVVTDASSA